LVAERGELRPDGSSRSDGKLYSRLINTDVEKQTHELVLRASYAIDKIPKTPKACLTIIQEYEFFEKGFNVPQGQEGPCEPSGSIGDCAKFRPMVGYSFQPG